MQCGRVGGRHFFQEALLSANDERASAFFSPAPVAVPAGAPVTGAFLKSYLHLHAPSGNPLYKGVPANRRPAGGRKSLHPSFTAAVAGPTGIPVAPHGYPRRSPRVPPSLPTVPPSLPTDTPVAPHGLGVKDR